MNTQPMPPFPTSTLVDDVTIEDDDKDELSIHQMEKDEVWMKLTSVEGKEYGKLTLGERVHIEALHRYLGQVIQNNNWDEF